MENSGRELAYPTFAQIVEVNRRMIISSGGSFFPPHNIVTPGSLEYILETLSSQIFGTELYPSIEAKAAALCFKIIKNHVFWKGNKRTGVHMSFEFLRSNGVPILLDISAGDIARRIADCVGTYEEMFDWISERVEPNSGGSS